MHNNNAFQLVIYTCYGFAWVCNAVRQFIHTHTHIRTHTHTHTHTGHQPPKPLRFLERVEKPVPRPPTPCVASPTVEEEEGELAVVLLQRVLRGRAIQAKVRRAHHTITLTYC